MYFKLKYTYKLTLKLNNNPSHWPDNHKYMGKSLDHQLLKVPCTKGTLPVLHHSDLKQTLLQCFFQTKYSEKLVLGL